jgi:pyruvate dehydrogenase E2 component (dihydrolipoamide acetyltransferase)
MALVNIQVPDIGDFDEVGVIELLVKVGDTVKAEQSLITVESDKASMEIPSSHAGVVKELKVALGDKVKQGSVIAVVEAAGATAAAPAAARRTCRVARRPAAAAAAPVAARPAPAAAGPVEVRVPDIGDFKDVAVIELLVKPGDTVKVEQSLITVESDKASMEIPSPAAGVLKELKVKMGDTVNIGDLVAILEGVAAAPLRLLHRTCCRSSRSPQPPWLRLPCHGSRSPCGLRPVAVPPHQPGSARWACPTPAPRCASSPASWACRWKKSRAAAPRAASPRTTSRASPSR